MRILHVITRLIIGGAQENTVSSVLGLRAKPGMDVQLITGPTTGTEGSLDSVLANNSLPLTIVPPLVRPLHPWKDWMACALSYALTRTRMEMSGWVRMVAGCSNSMFERNLCSSSRSKSLAKILPVSM